MSSNFNFYVNRQGVQGQRGAKGEQGFSPVISVESQTANEYILKVENEDGSFTTPNLRGNAIENNGGTYIRFNPETGQMYTGFADSATTEQAGVVRMGTYEDLIAGESEELVPNVADVHNFVQNSIGDISGFVTTSDFNTYTTTTDAALLSLSTNKLNTSTYDAYVLETASTLNGLSTNKLDASTFNSYTTATDAAIGALDNNKLDFTGLANTLAAGTNITITPNTSTGKITIAGEPVSQAQADWSQTDTNAPDYIKNKPAIPEAVTVDSELSSTSTNPVQNRLITNAINLISNEFENYATNKLDNLSNEGKARLHALKCYSDNGELLTDSEGLLNVIKYAHSTFDLTKFSLINSPTITSDGIASGFNNGNIKVNQNITLGDDFELYLPFTCPSNMSTLVASNKYFCRAMSGASYRFNACCNADGSASFNMNDGGHSLGEPIVIPSGTMSANESAIIVIKQKNQVCTYGYIKDGAYIQTGQKINYPLNMLEINNFYIGRNNAADYFVGSVDLKYLKAVVSGVEVLSGNKTGIDTIKPDDYTVVGTPTISADGIASGFSNSNYIVAPNNFLSADTWKIEYPISATQTNQAGIISILTDYCLQIVYTPASKQINYVLSSNGSSWDIANSSFVASSLDNTKDSIFVIEYTGTQYKLNIYQNDVNVGGVTIDNTAKLYQSNNQLILGNNRSRNAAVNGSIDLNAFKIYVDGDLVYQPCLKIPYTESKTGSKVVNSIYRGRVNDMASQFGYANYYTLDEDNGNFTLPQVELYGLIEKAASTVPSGVVQSSTINNIVSLTQAEYDALTTKDANTFYVITPST